MLRVLGGWGLLLVRSLPESKKVLSVVEGRRVLEEREPRECRAQAHAGPPRSVTTMSQGDVTVIRKDMVSLLPH